MGFVPGLQLSWEYYDEVVRDLIGDTPHIAARLGWGSDVLGFDTARSTDHGWGPRVQLFVPDDTDDDTDDTHEVVERIVDGLPERFRGWPTRFGWDTVVPRHWVEVTTLERWLVGHLGFEPRPEPALEDWLTCPQQLLLGVTAGAVFHDPGGELRRVREILGWYPADVWRHALASGWQRIAEEEHFVGRTHEIGDRLGSNVIVARLVRDVMRLAFLLERRYAPYSKWFGTAFARLAAAPVLMPLLDTALTATDWPSREDALTAAYQHCASATNRLGLTEALDPSPRQFHTRPFRVIDAARFAVALQRSIRDQTIRALPLIGTIDQHCDNTTMLEHSRKVS